jgi:hypothetical protein
MAEDAATGATVIRAGALRLRLLSVTAFPVNPVLGQLGSRLSTDHPSIAKSHARHAALDPVRGMSGRSG